MIVESDGAGGLVLIAQEDHARLCGDLAVAIDPAPPLMSALVAAARVHDNGWREADAAAAFDAEAGRPHTYRSTSGEPYRAIWRRGIERAVAIDPLVGALVTMHGARFFHGDNAPFREWAVARGAEALAAAGVPGSFDAPPPDIMLAFEWLRFLDMASLFVCHGRAEPWDAVVGGVEHELSRGEDGAAVVEPWPFRGALTLGVPTLRVEGERFADEAAFRAALAQGRRGVASFSFRPKA